MSFRTLFLVMLCWHGAIAFSDGGDLSPQEDLKVWDGFGIEVLPSQAFTSGRVLLRLKQPPAVAIAALRWETSGGFLLWDDLPEVEWRTPPEEGEFIIKAWETGLNHEGASRRLLCEARVGVLKPSTHGMVWIPSGCFVRGDVRGSRNLTETKTTQNASDEPASIVYVDGYWIDRLPVTHESYVKFLESCVNQGLARVTDLAVMGYFDGAWTPFYYFQSYERLVPYYREGRNAKVPSFLHVISHDSSGFHVKPGWARTAVVDVSWFGAAAYARFHGKVLPSEAQWEKAARGPDDRRYPWGDSLPTSYHVPGSYCRQPEPVPVGQFSPLGDSPYGVADMLSNNFEWSNDWFNSDYYADAFSEVPLRNPTGTFWGKAHALKGSPYGFEFPQSSYDDSEPVSNRYSWFFEFQIGDSFGNRNTTFRTALPVPRKLRP